MPQQTTLLSFFNRTPKSSNSTPSTSGGAAASSSKNGSRNGDVNGVATTPKSRRESSPLALSPVSRGSVGTKRRRESGISNDNQAVRKKLKNEDSRKRNSLDCFE